MPAVIDTNVLIGFALRPTSVSRQAVERVLREEEHILQSDETFGEFRDVLLRPKFDRYVSRRDRQSFIWMVALLPIRVQVAERIRVCSDPEDDKFLEVAANGGADVLLTGDRALLALHPFRGVQVLTPAAHLRRG